MQQMPHCPTDCGGPNGRGGGGGQAESKTSFSTWADLAERDHRTPGEFNRTL